MGLIRSVLVGCKDNWIGVLFATFCVIQGMAAASTAVVIKFVPDSVISELTDVDTWATFILTMCLAQYLFMAITSNGEITRAFMAYILVDADFRTDANSPHLDTLIRIMCTGIDFQEDVMADITSADKYLDQIDHSETLRAAFVKVCSSRNFGVTADLHALFFTLIPLMFGIVVPFINARIDGWNTMITNGTILFIVLLTYVLTIRMSDPLLYSTRLFTAHRRQLRTQTSKRLGATRL